jgi:hypothetical protein
MEKNNEGDYGHGHHSQRIPSVIPLFLLPSAAASILTLNALKSTKLLLLLLSLPVQQNDSS